MKVKVYPGPFCKTDALDEDGLIDLEEGAVLGDLYKKLKYPLPLRNLGLCTVNYKAAKRKTKLKEGDIVSFYTPLTGG